MRNRITLSLLTLTMHSYGQYPFEKYRAPKYKEYTSWKEVDKDDNEKQDFTLNIPKFFNKKDSLTIQLTSYAQTPDSSYITLLWNGKPIQRFFNLCGLA